MTEEEAYHKAKKKVKAKKGFYMHFGSFCATTLFLFTINFLTSPNFWWFLSGFSQVSRYNELYGTVFMHWSCSFIS